MDYGSVFCPAFAGENRAHFAVRSGGPRLKQTEQYPSGFGRSLALRHLFRKDWDQT